ncbi:hypothetical protein RJT34_03529 [Clitoria ternatea]|uniref:DYW domain-containing protein n=1 Tax=Clitoria ternatea TaxID=43366 RepID=A0AAN9KJZ3_CLITE
MSKSIAKSSTCSSPYHTHPNNKNNAKSPHRFIFFRQSWTTQVSRIVGVSASLSKTTHAAADYNNASIRKFCEMGNLRNAMELLEMSQTEVQCNTLCSLVQLCADRRSLEDGKRVHSIITSNGFQIDEVLGAKLVYMYVNCGDLVRGSRIFEGIHNDKVFLWNLLMTKYSQIGNFMESVSLYEKMQKLGIKGNSFTFTCILKCFAVLGKVRESEKVHTDIMKLGFGSYTDVISALIAAYFKFGQVESALDLFDELPDRSVITWNSMINGCVMNGFSRNGLEFFIQMLNLGVGVDSFTLTPVVVACANIGNLSLGRATHGYAVKTGLSGGLFFDNTLLDMYSKCGNLNSATQVFEKMGETNIVSWTSIMTAYVRGGLYEEAITLFDEMQSKGYSPDTYVMTSVINACAYSDSLDKGRDVHNYIKKNNMELDLPVSNALMNMYAKCGSMEEASSVFSQIPVKDIVSWNTIIGGYSQNLLPSEALKLFVDMQKQFKPNDITMVCILPACAGLAALEKGREIHGYIIRAGHFSDKYVACALVDMYVKCGLLVLAQLLFDMTPEKDLILWTCMVAGYGMHGFGKEAVSMFEKMRNAGVEPRESSFTCILYACSHSGLVEEGWEFFNSMRNEFYIEPKLEHYGCMVDLLARTGNLSDAYSFIESMPIEPNARLWGSLLSGCRIHHDVELAEKVAEHIFELEPESTRYYVLLSNIYAEAEKLGELKKLQRRIRKWGVQKDQGCSWIEVEGKFNIFIAGATSHPQAKRIDSLLRKLNMKRKSEGYDSKMKYALINTDDMKQEALLCGHSEQLAMAFGILNLRPGRIVRVTKNLRICGDCHEMGKFISKITEREIVLRDSIRFHHFKDGSCSCRGFW